ncbi:ribonuclease H2 catalytic subunit RNH201 [Aspergillus saccharolyticus JOP 1030-1]|uniref:Ribonuclease n=1 Tax=Aspergillus saccharolyticus JOP 1030-1 TaxID=1450539 RepID=A0A318Z1J0_9EURO|nr:ribonuclease H2 subunit A [Aspergillus saccharolyticus JOP 1030-1]PYH41165.1 ribonuclease H2 subunit A [Aspergillus saccharolyticus JOP 1030-1]
MEADNQNGCDLFQGSLSTSAPTSLFVPPSIDYSKLLSGESYSYFSSCPPLLATASSTAGETESFQDDYLVLGVDEAGRGPVLGPMVYSAFYLPRRLHHSLLSKEYSFNDSKVLTPGVRMNLMRLLCTPRNPLFEHCGWAAKLLSARDISSGMMRPGAGSYNLNAQAMDATVELIRGIVEERSLNVREVYIDTVGNPATYQQRLEKIFPSLKITVAKKADSLYPCVSAASVVAKVTRDISLELCHEEVARRWNTQNSSQEVTMHTWGSGYPSDSKCVTWLRTNMDPIFGWGNECRFSWGTVKEMLESKGGSKVDWPGGGDMSQLKDFLLTNAGAGTKSYYELREWYGSRSTDILL